MTHIASSPFPWPADKIPHYTAYRVDEPLAIDGQLREASWQHAPRSPRFVDLISGARPIHDTYSAILWDDRALYVGFWVEEPFVTAYLTERDSLIYEDNDIEIFIAGQDTYYEFEMNAFGTVYEVFFIWKEAYARGGYDRVPEFQRDRPGVEAFNGVGFTTHPRGPRIGYWNWDFPGLQSAVHVDGTINQNDDRDRGWRAAVALPWAGMKWLAHADGRSLPPKDGDTWRMDFSRFNHYKEAPPAQDSGGWAWGAHGIWDSHIPELFPYIHFSEQVVTSVGSA